MRTSVRNSSTGSTKWWYSSRWLASLELSQEALDKLIAVGFDPVYGARPLKRAIQRWIENPLAQLILAGKFAPGASISAKVEGDEIVFA